MVINDVYSYAYTDRSININFQIIFFLLTIVYQEYKLFNAPDLFLNNTYSKLDT